MMSRTVACLAIWFIGIHGEQAGEDGPSGYDHHPKSCVSSHNIKSYTDRTPEQCAELCNIYGRGCKGFEIFVDYGIRSGRRDDHCTLQDSANYDGCNGASYNLDFYAKSWHQRCSSACSAERDDFEEDDDPVAVAGFVGYSGYFVLAVLCFSIIAFGQRQRQRQLRGQLGMRQQQATLPPDAALQMMQTVGVLPPAAQMQAGGQPAAGYPQEGPVPYGGGAYPQRPAKCRTAVAPSLRARQRWRRQCLPPAGVPQSCTRPQHPSPTAMALRPSTRQRSRWASSCRPWQEGRRRHRRRCHCGRFDDFASFMCRGEVS